MTFNKTTKTWHIVEDSTSRGHPAGGMPPCAFYQSGLVGLAITSPDKGWIRINSYLCQLLEYSEQELRGMTWAELTHPEDLAADVEQFNLLIANKIDGYSLEKRFISHSGNVVHTELDVRCTRNPRGDIRYITAMVKDISKKAQAESALQQYKNIIKTTSDGLWVVDLRGNILEVNQAYADMSGFTIAELSTMQISQLEAIETPKDIQDHISKIVAHGRDLFETKHRRKDGVLIDVEASVNYMAEQRQFFVFFRDITKRKQAENEMAIAAVTFETGVGIVVTDVQKRILRVNRAFKEAFGYDYKEAIGKPISMFISGLSDIENSDSIWASVNRKGSWKGEVQYSRKGGKRSVFMLDLALVTDADERITNYVAMLTDMSVQKQAEKILLDARHRLENQVKKTENELEVIKKESTEITIALNVLLKHRQSDLTSSRIELSRGVNAAVLPFLKKLKRSNTDQDQEHLLETVESNLQHIVNSYTNDGTMSSVFQKLSSAEIQVALLIRNGLATKHIASMLNISAKTVSTHRKHIRKKLGLDGKSINLQGYFLSKTESE